MAKTFYTERDIEDLARRGVHSLTVDDNIVLTELAVEKARRLGVALLRPHDTPPSAPVRPYIAGSGAPAGATQPAALAQNKLRREELHERVRSAVLARLGNDLDQTLLDGIIRRVLDNLGV